MISTRSLVCLIALAVAGCDKTSPPDQANLSEESGKTPASFSPAERVLLGGGATAADVLAARAFVAPFTRTDQAKCFGDADLASAEMLAAERSTDGPEITRVAIAVDGSGSMAGRIGGRTKLELARQATVSFIDSLPNGVPASLSVFGQQGDNSQGGKARSCGNVDVLAPMAADRAKLKGAVDKVRAVGWTPLAAGLRAAQGQLGGSAEAGSQVIYVVSDGIETCGGDPVAVAREINRGSTRAIVNIIGFGLPTGEAATLRSVAAAGGGQFINVTNDDEFKRAMAGYREQMRLAENRVRGGMASARNAIATGATSTDAVQCTGQIIAPETESALRSYDAREKRGETLPPRYQIVALLKEHHAALARRRDDYAKRLGAARDSANDAVEQTRKQAE